MCSSSFCITRKRRLTRGDNAVEWHLAHDQEDNQSHSGPYDALLERDLGLGDLDLGDERGEWLHQVEKTDCADDGSADGVGLLLCLSIDAATALVQVRDVVDGDTYGHS